MSCTTCFEDWVCKCIYDTLIINTRLTPGQTYYWRVTDQFNQNYSGAVVAEADGVLQIPIEDLPEGLINQFAGRITITIHEDLGCSSIAIPLAKKYDCIDLEVRGGSEQKETIGCAVPCAAGSGTTVMIDFEDDEEISIDWTLYSATMGNNPIIQVYHEISADLFQLVDVAIQQNRTNGILTSIVVNNAGPATGYILITA